MIDPAKTLRSIEKIKGYLREACTRAMTTAVHVAETNAQQTTSFYDRSGDTRRSIKGTAYIDGLHGSLIGKKATRFLNFGTKDHGPVTAPYLRFQINGQWVRAKWVRGIKASHFMQHAANVGAQSLRHGLAYYLNQAMRKR